MKKPKRRQLELPGTARPRRGRPRVHPPGEARHVKRPRLTGREPLHVTLRTTEDLRHLRNRHTCEAVRRGLEVTFRRADMRICQLSVQHGHIHLIVEADHAEALARGMQAFQIACAKRLNRLLSRRNGFVCKGRVFADRYHARVLRSPRQTRNALRYVLSNFRKHGQGRGLVTDPYSTASAFDGWRRPARGERDGPLVAAQ
jgi:REP element-mobilizing transposase RayT